MKILQENQQKKQGRTLDKALQWALQRVPKQLRNKEFRFVPITMERDERQPHRYRKAPFEKNWSTVNNYRFDDPKFLRWLSVGYNYGVVCGYGNLAVIDCDEQEIIEIIEKQLPATFTVRTGSSKPHFYYIVPGLDKKIVLRDKDKKHYGEIQWAGAQAICSDSIHPNNKRYEVAKDIPIATISKELIETVFEGYIQEDVTEPRVWEQDATATCANLDILKVISTSGLKKHGNEYQGPHPVHGSKTGGNFCVNPAKGTWHCFRCDTGGGALSLIAVLEGIIDCSEAKPGALKGKKFTDTLKVAKEKYNIEVDVNEEQKAKVVSFSLNVGEEEAQVKFKLSGGKILYSFIKGEGESLETRVDRDFFQIQTQRQNFYKNAEVYLGTTNKESRKNLRQSLDRVLLELQKSPIFKIATPNKRHKKQQEQKKQNDVITETELDEWTKVVLTKEGIFLDKISGRDKTTGEEIWLRKKVYIGPFRPKEKLLVDGFTVVRYMGVGEQIDDFQCIVRRMKKEGGVVSKNLIEDCVNAVCLDLQTRTGHATYGVYEKNGNLSLCLDALPIKEAQKRVKIRCNDALDQQLTKEALIPYIELINHWHPYEILPSMGMGTISPFALMLRKKGYLICHIAHFSPAPKLGKSTVQHVYSHYLFNIFPVSGDSIGSRYRLSTVIDSICGFISIDEAENLNWREMTDLLKESPENYMCNIRGTPDLGIIEFLSRGVLGINCNRFKINDESVLVRILKIEFDNTCVSERGGNPEKVEELKHIIDQLEPIGWRLIEIELEDLKYSFDELLRRISVHETNLKERYSKFIDPRRVATYAAIYEGLKIWELAASKWGVDWRAPSYDDFVTQVVDKVERSTEEAGEPAIVDFFHWWEMWKVKNTRKEYLRDDDLEKVIVGKGEIWTDGKTIEHGKKTYEGEVITGTVLREYKADKQAKIDSLPDVAKAVEQKTGIPKAKLLKPWDIEGNTRWAVFIPKDIWKFKDGQTDLAEAEQSKEDPLHDKLQKMKKDIEANRKAGYKIDDNFLYANFDSSTIEGAFRSKLLIKLPTGEYQWSN